MEGVHRLIMILLTEKWNKILKVSLEKMDLYT